MQRAVAVAIAIVGIWMAAQNVVRAKEMRAFVSTENVSKRDQFVESVRRLDAQILSESALWPVLAGRDAVVPDAFAAGLVFRAEPGIEQKLIDEIRRHKYGGIVLEFDPASPEGRRMYENAHFGSRVIAAIASAYRLETQPLPNAFVFVPRGLP